MSTMSNEEALAVIGRSIYWLPPSQAEKVEAALAVAWGDATALRVRAERAEAEAARYQWVRENCGPSGWRDDDYAVVGLDLTVPKQPGTNGVHWLPEMLDAAIDAKRGLMVASRGRDEE